MLVSELAIETLDVSILPGRSRLDEECFHVHSAEPTSDDLGRELGAIVTPDVLRDSSLNEELSQAVQNVLGVQSTGDSYRQALPRVLIDHRQDSKHSPFMSPGLNEIVGPHMILVLWPKPNARSVVEPEPAPFRLLLRDFESFATPDSLNSLVIDTPTSIVQKSGDPSVSVPAKLARKLEDLRHQVSLEWAFPRSTTLSRSGLAKNSAGTTLGNVESSLDALDNFPSSTRARQFPRAASLRIAISSCESANKLFSLEFSRSSSFRRFA